MVALDRHWKSSTKHGRHKWRGNEKKKKKEEHSIFVMSCEWPPNLKTQVLINVK